MAKAPKRPTRDEFQLEEIGEKLVDAQQENLQVSLNVWQKGDVRGVIVEMDSRTKLIHVEQFGRVVKIPFLDIMQVNRV